MKNVLLLKAGEAAASVRLSVGDYDRWFLQTVGLSGYRFDILPVHQGAQPPADGNGYDAVIQSNTFDPGVEASRLAVRIPVIGLLRASLHFAASICDRSSGRIT